MPSQSKRRDVESTVRERLKEELEEIDGIVKKIIKG